MKEKIKQTLLYINYYKYTFNNSKNNNNNNFFNIKRKKRHL